MAVFGGWALLGPNREARSDEIESNRPLPVETTVLVGADSYELLRSYTGQVEARRSSELGFEQAGEILAVEAAEGSFVEAGTPLARLDNRRLTARRRQVAAQRDAARALLDELVAGARAEDIAEAKARVEELKARHDRLVLRLERLTELRRRQAATEDEYDATRFETQAAGAALQAARQQHAELVNGTRQEQIRAQRAVVEQLEAQLAVIDVDLEDSVITAPFAGRIDRHLADEGTIVSAGRAVIRIVEVAELEAWIGVPVRAAARIEVGAVHELRIGDGTTPGRVTKVMPQVTGSTRTRQVVVRIESPQDFVPGQVVRLEIAEEVADTGFWVPTTALAKSERGLWSAYAVNPTGDGRARLERADVELLHTDGDRVYVRGPLIEGDRIVSSGVHRVVPGQVVTFQDR